MSTRNLELFQDRLNELKSTKRFRLREVGKACGVSVAAVSEWLNGRNFPTDETAGKLARFLEVNQDWLEGRTEDSPALKESATEYKTWIDRVVSMSRPFASRLGISPELFVEQCVEMFAIETHAKLSSMSKDGLISLAKRGAEKGASESQEP